MAPGLTAELQLTLTHADPWSFTLRGLSIYWETLEP